MVFGVPDSTGHTEIASVLAEDLGFSECLIQEWQDLASPLEDTPARGTVWRSQCLWPLFPSEQFGRRGPLPSTFEPSMDTVPQLRRFSSRSYIIWPSRELDREARSSGQVLHLGMAAGEPPGTSLSETQLFPVILDFVVPEDWPLVDRGSATVH